MGPATRSLLVVLALPVIAGARCSLPWGPPAAQGPQGWSSAETNAWYTVSQGSRLVPQAWIDALEQPDKQAPFLDPAYIEGFRYLPHPAGAPSLDPSCPTDPALPLGFAVDCQSDASLSITKLRWKTGQSDREPWVGMNCSACHTAELTYQGKTVRIDGGPTMADFQSFTEALDNALQQTLSDPARFSRFAAKVLGAGAPPADSTALHDALARLVGWNAQIARLNGTQTSDPIIRYGFGRLDAIGHIFNKAALVGMANNPADQLGNPSDAPVSYPFLWNITQQDKVEWNGLADNNPVGVIPGLDFDVGAAGRNTGEVVGVFGDITIKPNVGLEGYVSSINVNNLVKIEEQLQSLAPPKWPDSFPPIDQAMAKQGADLFVSKGCNGCHTVPSSPVNLTERYTVSLQKFHSDNPKDRPTNTDMWMTCNAVLDMAASGTFTGSKVSIVAGTVLQDSSYNVNLVKNTVTGALLGRKGELIASAVKGVFGIDRGLVPRGRNFAANAKNPKEARRAACLAYQEPDPKNPLLVYKGRPLQAIWATAPYLHNGSVVSLYELLLPPAQRRTSFYTGTREFDPKNVGFVPDQSADNTFLFETQEKDGTPKDGNANTGHDYGNAKLTDAERWELVEYMKTL
jgi:hypothetical protein